MSGSLRKRGKEQKKRGKFCKRSKCLSVFFGILTPVVSSPGSSQTRLDSPPLVKLKQRQADGALNGLPISTSCACFPFFPFSLPVFHSSLHLPFFVFVFGFFNSFALIRGQFPRLSADAGRLLLWEVLYYFLYNINIPILPIILHYYYRPSRWALVDKAFFWGLSGVISLQSPSCPACLSFAFALLLSIPTLFRFRASSGLSF